jgi:hypothetical protein
VITEVYTPQGTFRTQRARLSQLCSAKKERAERESCLLCTSVVPSLNEQMVEGVPDFSSSFCGCFCLIVDGMRCPVVLGYHLKTGHTLSVQNRPTRLAEDVIVLPCCSVRLQGLGLSPRSGV